MRKLLFLLPFAAMFLGSCLKSDDNGGTTVQIVVPSGTFNGQFRKIHRSTITGKLDTLKASFLMKMSTDSGFKVLADTTKIHAGSKGPFQVTTNFINFIDNTYPKTGIPAKTHLSGTYQYVYDGTTLQIASIINPTDTIFYQYDLKRN